MTFHKLKNLIFQVENSRQKTVTSKLLNLTEQ